MNSPSPNVHLKLDHEDKALLQRMMAAEKLNRSDVVRRAIRAYAKQLGIEPPKAA